MKKNIKKIFTVFTFICALFSPFMMNVLADSEDQILYVGGETSKDGITVSKKISKQDVENYFDITLNVKTSTKIEEIVKDQDLAIVIVMDASNSMYKDLNSGNNHNFKANKNETRYDAAVSAAEKLIKDFATYSNGVNASRKIGYVSFNTNAYRTFALQDCKKASTAASLVKTMKEKTKETMDSYYEHDKKGNIILNDDGSGKLSSSDVKYSRFTNIEAGLKMANDMLEESGIQNKYIIFLSDGFPTTYIESGYNGYKNWTPDAKSSSVGQFFDEVRNKPCSYGADYSDLAAKRAQNMASTIKSKGTKIFATGVGIKYQKTIATYVDEQKEEKYSTIDRTSSNYVIGDNIESYTSWLKNNIGSNYYVSTDSVKELETAYSQIFEQIKSVSKTEIDATWAINDPMNEYSSLEYIDFVGFYDQNNNVKSSLTGNSGENDTNTATVSDNTISWDLKNSGYTVSKVKNITYYSYSLKYKVRLKNELKDFNPNSEYNTNGETTLKYSIRENDIVSPIKEINFEIPMVKGYLGELSFLKISGYNGENLQGAQFKLTHADNCICTTQKEYPTIKDIIVESDKNGLVSFKNIPSGHSYVLTEIKAPKNYKLDNTKYIVTVEKGKVSISPNLSKNNDDIYTITNKIETGNIKISKVVSYGDKTKDFNFKIVLSDKNINGEYGDLVFKNGSASFTLKDGETKKIDNLPATISYTITEEELSNYTTTSEGSTGTVIANKTNEVIFTNHKNPNPISVLIKASKTFDGLATKRVFSFELMDENKKVIQTKYNAFDEIKFDELIFTSEGQYTYYLKEITQNSDEINFDKSIYTIIIDVEKKNNEFVSNIKYLKDGKEYTNIPLFANKSIPISISVNKVWKNDDANTNKPENISVQLYKDGKAYGNIIKLDKTNNWCYVWDGLNRYANYTLDEVDVPRYYSKSIERNGNSFTITNTYLTTSVTVNKIWKDDNASSNRPNLIRVQLYKNGKVFGDIVELSRNNNWKYVWDNLEQGVKYTVDEIGKYEGYTKTITKNGENNFTIINKCSKPIENPYTGDNISDYIILFVFSFISLIVCIFFAKKQ